MATVKNTREVRVDDLVPLLECKVGSTSEDADARIIDKDIGTTKGAVDEFEEFRNLAAVRYIDGFPYHFAAALRREIGSGAIDVILFAPADCERSTSLH